MSTCNRRMIFKDLGTCRNGSSTLQKCLCYDFHLTSRAGRASPSSASALRTKPGSSEPSLAAPPGPHPSTWRMDLVTLSSGHKHPGLLLKASSLRLQLLGLQEFHQRSIRFPGLLLRRVPVLFANPLQLHLARAVRIRLSEWSKRSRGRQYGV